MNSTKKELDTLFLDSWCRGELSSELLAKLQSLASIYVKGKYKSQWILDEGWLKVSRLAVGKLRERGKWLWYEPEGTIEPWFFITLLVHMEVDCLMIDSSEVDIDSFL